MLMPTLTAKLSSSE